MKKILILFIILFLLTSCIPGDGKHTKEKPAGFLWGIWHGWIAPISLIISIFNPSVRIYETANSGCLYDFAFYIAILGGFGGISLTRKRKSKK